MRKVDLAGAAAQLLDILTENKRHHTLLDAALSGLDDLLAKEDTRRFIAAEVAKSAPLLKKISDWLHLDLDERAALKIVELAIEKISEVRRDRGHELRRQVRRVRRRLHRAAEERRGRCAARSMRMRDELLESPALATYIGGLWQEFRGWLGEDLQSAASLTHQRIAAMVRAFGEQLEADREIRQWIDEQILKALPPLVEEHRAKIGRFVEDQINGWQEKKLVRGARAPHRPRPAVHPHQRHAGGRSGGPADRGADPARALTPGSDVAFCATANSGTFQRVSAYK